MWREAEDAAEAAPAPFRSLLRQYRLGAGLTQDALAERAGLSVRAIQNLERGERRPVRGHRPPAWWRRSVSPGRRGTAFELAARRPRRRRPVLLHGREPHPPAPPSLPPTNLPATLTACIGREAERAAVLKLLRTARLVTLTGPGGCGKTRIALQVGTDLASLAGPGDGGGEPADRARTAGRAGPPDQGRRPQPGRRAPRVAPAPGAAGGRAGRLRRTAGRFRTGCGWRSWPRWPTRPWCRRRWPRRWACRRSPAGPCWHPLRGPPRAAPAAAAGQLRAPPGRSARLWCTSLLQTCPQAAAC